MELVKTDQNIIENEVCGQCGCLGLVVLSVFLLDKCSFTSLAEESFKVFFSWIPSFLRGLGGSCPCARFHHHETTHLFTQCIHPTLLATAEQGPWVQ